MDAEIIGRYMMIDDTRIYYEDCGAGIPLFCIHSANACSLEYHSFAPLMVEKGFRVIMPDLPGHGKSFPRHWDPIRNMHEYAEFVWRIIQKTCSENKPVVTGCSIGGDMVLDLACHHSEDMLAAIAMDGAAHTPIPPVRMSERPHEHAYPSWYSGIDRGVQWSCAHPLDSELGRELAWVHHFAHPEVGNSDLQCWSSHDVRDKLGNIKCPVLVLAGEASPFVSEAMVQETVSRIPEGLGQGLMGKKVGHYPMFERPQYTAEVFMNFLFKNNIIYSGGKND